jgi:hypothetical protein
MAVAIELISKFFHIFNGSVSFGGDCEAALYYIFDRNKKSTAKTTYFDLIMARKVLVMFQHTKISQGTKWIYGGEQTTIVIQMLRPFEKKNKHQVH